MDYKLAKELKEAGFPQKTEWYWINWGESWVRETPDHFEVMDNEFGKSRPFREMESISCPTLSELIEACGVRFNYLLQQEDKWVATDYREGTTDEYGSNTRIGKTPEEAVARLWLALNKK